MMSKDWQKVVASFVIGTLLFFVMLAGAEATSAGAEMILEPLQANISMLGSPMSQWVGVSFLAGLLISTQFINRNDD
jgi:Mn2+/Fe2+ NRAMP family transporter